jgi:hypothetical protein
MFKLSPISFSVCIVYVELRALEESMRYVFPQYRLTYFGAQLSACHVTPRFGKQPRNTTNMRAPWYRGGDNRQLNRPPDVPQY